MRRRMPTGSRCRFCRPMGSAPWRDTASRRQPCRNSCGTAAALSEAGKTANIWLFQARPIGADNERGESMARRGSSFGFMGMFGRSHDLRQLDQALRSVDVHPAVVPEAAKLTNVNLLKDSARSDDPVKATYRAAAETVGSSMNGTDRFARANAAEVLLA